MKKFVSIFIIFIFFSCNYKSSNTLQKKSNEILLENTEIITNKNVTEIITNKTTETKTIFEEQLNNSKINRDFLRSDFMTLNFWGEADYNINKWYLQFFRDFYQFRPPVEGDPPVIRGNYEIIDNKVILKYTDEPYGYELSDYKFDDILREDWELEYIIIENSLHFFDGLTGKGIVFGRLDSEPKKGDLRIINGHEIIMQKDEIRASSDVTVRIGPGINYQHFIFEWRDEYDSFEEDEYILKKEIFITEYFRERYPVYIIGHSKNIDTVDGLTGYWYYCRFIGFRDSGFEIIEPANIIDNSGWIFGPLLGLK